MNYHLWTYGKPGIDRDGYWFRHDRCVRCGCEREMIKKLYNGKLQQFVYEYKFIGFTFESDNRPKCMIR